MNEEISTNEKTAAIPAVIFEITAGITNSFLLKKIKKILKQRIYKRIAVRRNEDASDTPLGTERSIINTFESSLYTSKPPKNETISEIRLERACFAPLKTSSAR